MTVDMHVEFCGLPFQNPVSTASGTYGYGIEYGRFLPVETLGSTTSKAISLEARRGNPGVRLQETPAGMLNAIGLENPGVEVFKQTILPQMVERLGDCKIIANLNGNTVADYVAVAEALNDEAAIAIYEVNVSCPNVEAGGMAFGVSPEGIGEVCRAVKAVAQKPVMMKLSPNVTDIVAMAQAAQEAGADALSLVNTFLGLHIDIHTQAPSLGNVTGGLSGPAILPLGLRCVYQVAQAVDLPILGMGGIASWEDGVAYMLAGADMIAIGAGNFPDPDLPFKVLAGLERYCQDRGYAHVTELTDRAWRTP